MSCLHFNRPFKLCQLHTALVTVRCQADRVDLVGSDNTLQACGASRRMERMIRLSIGLLLTRDGGSAETEAGFPGGSSRLAASAVRFWLGVSVSPGGEKEGELIFSRQGLSRCADCAPKTYRAVESLGFALTSRT